MAPYSVALVLDSAFGEALKQLAERLHVWVVDTPANRAVAESVWASEQPFRYNIERGITTFASKLGKGPEEWCAAFLDTIDMHHDEQSHHPGYSVLEVYGLKFTDRLRPKFVDLGFTVFEDTDYGFRALETEA